MTRWPVLLLLAGCPQGEPTRDCLPPAALEGARTCLPDAAQWLTAADAPDTLAQTGCFADLTELVPTPGVVPYTVNSPLFSDDSTKRRWLAVPPGQAASVAADGTVTFPTGTVLLKHFAVEVTVDDGAREVPVETRVLALGREGWVMVTYVWNPAGTGAGIGFSEGERVVVDLGDGAVQGWSVPSQDACTYCHRGDLPVLGPTIPQLDLPVCYDGGRTVNQVDQLAEWGLMALPATRPEPLVDPGDADADLEARARSHLHANCGHCHRPGGWTSPDLTLDLRYSRTLAQTHTCDVPVQYGVTWDEVRLVPGNAQDSAIYARMGDDPPQKMPPFGDRFDADGIAVVGAWIEAMTGCP